MGELPVGSPHAASGLLRLGLAAMVVLSVACKEDKAPGKTKPPPGTTDSTVAPTGDSGTLTDTATDPLPPECADSLATWETVGQPLMLTWCTPCHSQGVPDGLRQDAPVGIDFDTYDQTVMWAARIQSRAVDLVDMPPSGGVPVDELELLDEWIRCGTPGSGGPLPVDPCLSAVDVAGDQLASQLSCATDPAVRVSGDLSLDSDADLSCVCEVDGDVTTDGASAVSLERLHRVGGDLVVSGPAITTFEAPGLLQVGAVTVTGAHDLVDLDLSDVRTAASITVDKLDSLPAVSFDELITVTGDLQLSELAATTAVSLSRLDTVGGHYVLRDLPQTSLLLGTHSHKSIGGDLVIDNLPLIDQLSDFSELASVGGNVEIRNTGAVALHGFHRLLTIGGDLVVTDNPSLERAHGFPDLTAVGGTFRFERNPSFFYWEALAFLVSVGGDFVIHDHPQLREMPRFFSLQTIAGDFVFTDNPGIPNNSAAALASGIDIGGTVTIGASK